MATKTAVIFKSKYGSTRKYAQWIAADLQADLFAADKIKVRDLAPYQTIVYGGYLYAGSIAGIKLLTKRIMFKNSSILTILANVWSISCQKMALQEKIVGYML